MVGAYGAGRDPRLGVVLSAHRRVGETTEEVDLADVRQSVGDSAGSTDAAPDVRVFTRRAAKSWKVAREICQTIVDRVSPVGVRVSTSSVAI